VKRRILDFIVCPDCGKHLRLEPLEHKRRENEIELSPVPRCSTYCALKGAEIAASSPTGDFDCCACYRDEIITGLLSCGCGALFPIVRGVPRVFHNALRYFSSDLESWRDQVKIRLPASGNGSPFSRFDKEVEQVRKRFEFQWQKWGRGERIFGRTEEEMLAQLTGKGTGSPLKASFYAGKLVLDAGCGHGRYVECFHKLGAEVVGMDLGEGIDIAYELYGHLPHAHFIQANILKAPLAAGMFDFVFSYGVLHHTPDTRAAFNKLAPLVAQNGWMEIWVYPREGLLWEVSQKVIRSITTRLPPAFLYLLCFIPVPLLKFKTYSGTNLSTSSWKECAQVIWDWYSPRYQWHHTRDEVRGWFEAAGFEDLKFFPPDVGAIGRKK